MAKYNAGDKVRVVKTIYSSVYNGYNVGDIFEVEAVFSESLDTVGGPRLWFKEVEKVSDKPTKNQRIKTLEQQVAELQAEVAALEKAKATPKFVPVTTDNIAVGDKIRVIGKMDIAAGHDLTDGEIYVVIEVEECGDLYVKDDVSDVLVIVDTEFSAIEKVVSE